MKRIFLFLLLQFLIASLLSATPIRASQPVLRNTSINQPDFNKADTIYRIVSVPGNTYGYEIIINNIVLIKQQTVPGKQGIDGFKNKTDAEKVAGLVIRKLKQGIMPPTIQDYELKQLKIQF